MLPLAASERSGKAEASWLTASATYRPGTAVRTAIRLAADPGWHTYWDNPGEGGMPTSIELQLPDGWTAGPVGRPVPVRFRTGDLPGFGYEGEVLFPVEITPPAGSDKDVVLAAELSWLACSDDACVPGEARIELTLTAGEPAPTADAGRIEQAGRRVPVAAEDASLEMIADGKVWNFTLRGVPAGFDPVDCEVFPLTPEVVDPAAVIRFVKQGDGVWTASAPRSEYATEQPARFELVLVPPSEGLPLRFSAPK